MRYNGKPSMFFPTQTASQQASAKSAPPNAAKTPEVPSASTAGTAATPGGSASTTPAPAAVAGEKINIVTDLMKVEIDSVGGEIRRLELLKHRDTNDPS